MAIVLTILGFIFLIISMRVSAFAYEWKTIEDNENSEFQENSTEKESGITDNA